MSPSQSQKENRRERGKRRKAAAADGCCGRFMTVGAELPSVPGSTGLKCSAEEQRWVPLFGQLQRSLGSSNQAKSMVSPTQIGPSASARPSPQAVEQ